MPAPATPAPASTDTPESLAARVTELESEVAAKSATIHERDQTIGRQGTEIHGYRQQVEQSAAPTAEPAAPDASANDAFWENPVEASRQIAREESAAQVQQAQTTAQFYADNTHLRDKQALVGQVVADMQASGELASMDQASAMSEIAKRATAQLAAPQEPGPTPPPVSGATAPPQSPAPPTPPGPEPTDHDAVATEERRQLGQEQQRRMRE